MKRIIFIILILTVAVSCGGRASSKKASSQRHRPKAPTEYTFRTTAVYPHSTDAYTQGLQWHEGKLYEGTGLNGKSQLRRINLTTGEVEKSISLPDKYFGEGITILGDKIYQLTWTSGEAFVYDKLSFKQTGSFRYQGQGWGLTTDGEKLYMSDGTYKIRVIDPETFAAEREIAVRAGGNRVTNLNELEWIDGEIWANVYMSDRIVRIDPQSGDVTGVIDLRGLQSQRDVSYETDVLNGIAYDAEGGRILLTGKNWNKIYQVEIIENGK